jgi:osmotically-inducible protein OsmY
VGLFSFVQDVGRKIGLFGGREAAEVEAAKAAATEAAAAATAAASVADAAAKEAARRAAVAADIKAAIISYVPVAKLEVAVDGATVTVRGTTYAQADREKAVLIAGNTEGVATVDDQLTVEVPEPPAVFHQVVKGDTLSAIAAKTYGVMRLYDVIFEANRPMLEHPRQDLPGPDVAHPAGGAAGARGEGGRDARGDRQTLVRRRQAVHRHRQGQRAGEPGRGVRRPVLEHPGVRPRGGLTHEGSTSGRMRAWFEHTSGSRAGCKG